MEVVLNNIPAGDDISPKRRISWWVSWEPGSTTREIRGVVLEDLVFVGVRNCHVRGCKL